jgi:hypothetical protein
MSDPTSWWITLVVKRYMRDGVAVLLSGPCGAHPTNCVITAQRLLGDWMEPEPWFKSGLKHPSMSLPASDGTQLFEQASQLSVSPVPTHVAGIDGETYTLEFGAGFNCCSFSWFMEPPLQWLALLPVAQQMEQHAERCLASEA